MLNILTYHRLNLHKYVHYPIYASLLFSCERTSKTKNLKWKNKLNLNIF